MGTPLDLTQPIHGISSVVERRAWAAEMAMFSEEELFDGCFGFGRRRERRSTEKNGRGFIHTAVKSEKYRSRRRRSVESRSRGTVPWMSPYRQRGHDAGGNDSAGPRRGYDNARVKVVMLAVRGEYADPPLEITRLRCSWLGRVTVRWETTLVPFRRQDRSVPTPSSRLPTSVPRDRQSFDSANRASTPPINKDVRCPESTFARLPSGFRSVAYTVRSSN